MSNYAVMPHSHFTALVAGTVATRRNRGRPGRKGLPSKRVIGPRPPDKEIVALLFYKESYNPDGTKHDAFPTDAKVREFMKEYGLTTFAPIENTPSFRRVRVNKAANFDIATLTTYRIQGHEDVLVITGSRLTPEQIAALGPRAVALSPRKRTTLAAASGIRVETPPEAPSETKTLGELTQYERRIARYEEILADAKRADAALTVAEVKSAVRYYRDEAGAPKTADQVKKMPPRDVRTLLLSDAKAQLKRAQKRAENVAFVERETAAPPSAPASAPAPRGRAAAPPPDVPTAEELAELLDTWNGDARAGEAPLALASTGAETRLTKKRVKEAYGDMPRAQFLAQLAVVKKAREKQNALEEAKRAAAVAAAEPPPTSGSRTRPRITEAPPAEPPTDEELFAEMEASEAATVAAPPPFATRPGRPRDGRETFVIETINAEGKAAENVNRHLKDVFKELGITNKDEQNVAANVILARALSGSDAMARADVFAEIYEQIKAQAGTNSLAAFAFDAGRLRTLDAILRSMAGSAVYQAPLGSMGRPTQHLRPRAAAKGEEEGEESGESAQAIRREEASLLRSNRRAPTIRKPRGSNRFKKVREAQGKQERLEASLPAVRRDLGLVRRRLTLLKGKRTAQAKYARDQLQAEATRLMRRIEKVEGQIERAAAAVARAVKAANPKKKQPKVKPLKQPKAKKPRATRKRPAAKKRSR